MWRPAIHICSRERRKNSVDKRIKRSTSVVTSAGIIKRNRLYDSGHRYAYHPSRICTPTTTRVRNYWTKRRSGKEHDRRRTQIRHIRTRMHRHLLGCYYITSIPARNRIRHKDGSWFKKVDYELHRKYWQRSALPFATLRMWVSRRLQSRYQAPNCKYALTFTYQFWRQHAFDVDLPLFAIEVTHNLADMQMYVEDTNRDDIVPMDGNQTKVSLDAALMKCEFLVKTAQETFCKTTILQLRCQGSEFYLDYRGLLVREFVVDEVTEVFVSKSFQNQMLQFSHHSPIAGHPGQRRMHDMLRQTDWPRVARNVCMTVA